MTTILIILSGRTLFCIYGHLWAHMVIY